MRTRLLIAALFAGTVFAENPLPSRPATDLEADKTYLGVLNSMQYDDALGMLTDVGVPEARARELLEYLAREIEDHQSVNRSDLSAICRNVDDQFSNPIALVGEIRRQKAAERAFQDSMLKRALEILGVPSLTPIRKPHMNNGGLVDSGVEERILDGRLKPADAIARACELVNHYPPPPAEGEAS